MADLKIDVLDYIWLLNFMTMIGLPDIEAVAAEVHLAWIESKKEHGFSSRKSEDEEELMVPYEQLSEKQKDLDRNTVKAVYAAIKKLTS